MGRGDNRLSRKIKRCRAQKKKKLKLIEKAKPGPKKD